MAPTPGTRLGVYEVAAQIGEGGMGQVYRATDTKLKRQVAIKILPPFFAADQDRLARFQREAEVLASLNHPHIAGIYGLEESGGVSALVMELVEGEDLSRRIARGAIPLDEALPIARQMAEGLEAAHEQGIIHRDLKPANIKVRDDGNVKILDFGLAKAVEAGHSSGGAANLSMSPTITSAAHMTSAGVILGTAAYMSPEQAKGRPVDKRADVWAFGVVLYEMLTGRPCFEGDDVSDTLAAILRGSPDWSALPANTPAAVKRLLRRCLEKDVRSRLSDMAMVRIDLRDADTEPDASVAVAPAAVAPPKSSAVRRSAPYAVALAAATVTGVVVWRVRQPVDPPRPIVRFSIDLPDQAQATGAGRNPVAISPDGTHLVYAANLRLYLRAVDQLDATPIAGTETGGPAGFARGPFFSPDGQSVAYWQTNQLRKIGLNGGAPVTICETNAAPVGARWEADGRILLGMESSIQWVPATGGTLATVISPKQGDRLAFPQLLPGGEWLLFTLFPAANSAEQGQVFVQSLKTSERRLVLDGAREAQYVSSGHLVFGRGNTLLAQPFDLRRMRVTGGPVPVLDGVSNAANQTPVMFAAVSSTGTLFYVPGRTGTATTSTKLVQVTRDGTRTVLAEVAGMSWYPRFSPDGSRVAYGMSGGTDAGDASDLWVLDLNRGARTRVTFGGNNRFYPIWTRDGTRLTHADGAAATNRLLSTPADGSGTSETLLDSGPRSFPSSWSPDGHVLAIYINGPTNTRDVAIVQKNGEKWTSTPLVATPFEERGAIFSPSGRWIVYVSNKTGQNDVFARPYPGPGPEVTISAGGGQEPVWAPSGKELFYRHGGTLLSVRIDETPSSLTVSAPARAFEDPYRLDTGGASGGMANYDIAPDGKRFVMIEEPKASSTPQALKFNVILNWTEELKARVPTK